MDDILKSLGFSDIKYDDLTPVERETFHSWLGAMNEAQITVEKIKGYVSSMKYAVESEITKPDLSVEYEMILRARLKNLMLIEAFLSTPARAKEELQRMLGNVTKKT